MPLKYSTKIKPGLERWLYILLSAAVIGLVVWGWNFQHQPATDKNYNSLDLSKARLATYTNKPLSTVGSLGIVKGVRESIISFGVPKDGLTEYGLMTLPPKTTSSSKWPVVILLHGYTNPLRYSTTNAYLPDMEFYSQHGFAVIKPDFRGQGFSLAQGTPDGAYYSMSYNTDVLSLIAAVKKTSYLDKGNINLWGQSMGGYIALRAAVLSPDIKNVILLSAPVGNIADMFSSYTASSDSNNPQAAEIKAYQLNLNGTPISNPKFWDKTSPLNYLTDTHAHIQINVGTADKVVPPHFSADLNQTLNRLKKPHDYYVYQGGTHGLLAQRQLIWDRSLRLLLTKPLQTEIKTQPI